MLKISTISGLIFILFVVPVRARTLGEIAPLSLAEAKTLAKRSNPTLRAAQERLYQAELMIDKAWTMVKPQWSATGTYTHYNTGMDLTYPNVTSIGTSEEVCGPFWNPDVGFCFTEYDTRILQKQDSFGFYSQITQPIFLARAISTIKSAYQTYDMAKISTENTQDYLLYTLEVAYYGALAARKFVEIADNAVSIRQEHLRVARTKFEGGETPKIAVLSAEISLNRAEQDKKSAENSLALSKESIMLLIGQRREFTLVEPASLKQPSESIEEFIEKAKTQRRDLTFARLNLELAHEMEKDAWYRFLPSLVATGNLIVSDVKGFTNEYVTWSVGLALSVPIYDGGLRYSYLQEAKSKIREANIQIDQTRQNIASEIRQLWLRREMAVANLFKSRHSLELAREQVELAKVSFDAGVTTNLEVLDANSVLFVSEINVTQEELNLQLAILRLQRSLSMYNPAAGLFTTGATSGSSGY